VKVDATHFEIRTHDTWQLLVKEVILVKDYSNCLGLGVCDGPRVTKSFKVVFEKTNSREMIQQRWKTSDILKVGNGRVDFLEGKSNYQQGWMEIV
jgi:hypothetical protein